MSVSGGFRASCEHFSGLLNGLPVDCLPTIGSDYIADVLTRAACSTYSIESVADKLSACHDSVSGKNRSMGSNSDNTSSDNNRGSVRDIPHNTNEWRDSDDRRSGNSIGGSSRSPSRNRLDHRKSRDKYNGAMGANDMSVCIVELL